MADNAVTRFENDLATKTTLTEAQRLEVRVYSNVLWRDSWAHHCDHQQRHLDAIALTNPLDLELQQRVTLLKTVIDLMRVEGMPEIVAIVP